jgi:uncharacterized protein YllA (UPF0747 family)
VYARLGLPRQVPLPRWSGLLVEPRVDRVLEKFGLELADLLSAPGTVEAKVVRSRLPSEVDAALATLRAAIEQGYAVLEHAATEIDPTLARPTQSARQQALGGTQDVEKKLVQHLKKRQETELGQLTRARTAVMPAGKPQERVLTVAPFLARYGPALLTDLSEAFQGWYATALEGVLEGA